MRCAAVKRIYFVILVFAVFLLSSCGPKCPECQAPGTWSACDDSAQKTRTTYQCNEATGFECRAAEEKENCRTEITAKGRVGDSLLRITPSIEKEVKGIITVEYAKVPEGTAAVAFAIGEGSLNLEEGGVNLPFDTDGTDGWSIMLDTTKYTNGLYEIAAIAAVTFEDGNPPLDAASVQILIKN